MRPGAAWFAHIAGAFKMFKKNQKQKKTVLFN
jgi:hypothetical protein